MGAGVSGRERRGSGRRSAPEDHGILSTRVRPGHLATVIDVSAGGALIETAHRLLPGSAIELQMETSSCRASMKGRVLRCAVSGLRASAIHYRGAIAFDGPLSWFTEDSDGYPVPAMGKRSALSFRVDPTPRLT
jgi:hypothetical protein